MKAFRSALTLVLILAAALTLCACGGRTAPQAAPTPSPAPATENPLAPYAGKYSFHCCWMSPEYVDGVYSELGVKARKVEKTFVQPDAMRDYTVTLKGDGTGYLYWGPENQGPIDWWKLEGEALQFQAGVSVFDGTLVDGYMTVTSEPGFVLYFAAPGAKKPDVAAVSMDEYLNLLYTRPVPTVEGMVGVYYPYAMEAGGYRVRSDEFGQTQDGSITLNGDGSAVMITGTVGNPFIWQLVGAGMVWYDESGTVSLASLLTIDLIRDGVFTVQYAGQDYITTYAREDADVSDIETISVEEFQALAAAQGEGA